MKTEIVGRAELSVVPVAEPRMPVSSPRGESSRRWGKTAAPVVAVLIVAALAFAAWRALLEPPAVTLVRPARGPAIEAVYATGVVEPIDYARFGATVAGRVAELLVDEGDVVRKGDVVARLDDSQPRARLRDARARLTMAEADIARDQTLMNRRVLAVQTLERAQQERDQAAAAVDLFARQVEDYTVLSPLAGTVMKRNVQLGETVAANTPMFEIVSTLRKRIAADVDERDIAGVELGARLAARADGFPDEVFTANVTNIRRQGDASSRTFRVEADLSPDTKLMIGMTVDVDVVIRQRPEALLLPAGAIAHGPSTGGRPGAPVVYVVDGGRVKRVAVKTGAIGPAKVEIVSGLADADAVVANPGDRLTDGQAVRVSP
jgi:HlyD family secretion protein